MPEFAGLKLSQDATACANFDVQKVEMSFRDRILIGRPGHIGSGSKTGGGNSGFHALNLAVQFGAKRIVLVGFDMRLDLGIHWHGRHPRGLNNPREPSLIIWRAAFNRSADLLAALGVEVLNASPVSKLTAYPIVDLREAVNAHHRRPRRRRAADHGGTGAGALPRT